jgi:allophanate hydrolase subunit 2
VRSTPVGTKFRFDLSEAARVHLSFQKFIHGRLRARGGFSVQRLAGSNAVRFAGKLPGGRRLAPGRYRVVVTATNAAGQRSAPKSLAFTVVA